MSWDYHTLMSRYCGHRVCIAMHHHMRLWGTLATVGDDGLRLLDTILVKETDEPGWLAHNQFADDDGGGLRYPETVIRIEQVLAITCVDGDVEPVPEVNALPDEEVIHSLAPQSDWRESSSRTPFAVSFPERTAPTPQIARLELGLAINVDEALSDDLERICETAGEAIGFPVPPIECRTEAKLPPAEFRLLIRERVALRASAKNTDWLEEILESILANGARFISCDAVENRLEELLENGWGALVRETVPARFALPGFVETLRELATDRINCSDLSLILESTLTAPEECDSPLSLAGHIRRDLPELMCKDWLSDAGCLPVYRLAPETAPALHEELSAAAKPGVVTKQLHAALAAREQLPLLVEPCCRVALRTALPNSLLTCLLAEDEIRSEWTLEVRDVIDLCAQTPPLRLLPAA